MAPKSGRNVYFVSSLEDNASNGTLRNAIIHSKLDDISIIIFTIAGTIKLNSSLPTLTSTVTIDGTNAPGYVGVPVVEIDCNKHEGIVFDRNSNNSSFQGISVTNACSSGIVIKSNNVTIISNYIGLDLGGVPKGNRKNGICLCKSSNNTIGANPNNISNYASNVISGNGENGIKLFCSNTNTIVSNYIGTDPSGLNPVPNGLNGILITDKSYNNQIGGTVYTNSQGITNNPTGSKGTVPIVYIFPPLGNLISSNRANGVLITKNSNLNVFNGNFIGVNTNGTAELGNGLNGILIEKSDSNILRGCLVDENPFVYYNVLSGNALNGIRVNNSNNTIIQGNFFGIGADNASIVSNKLNGILIDGNSSNTTDGGVIPLGNVSSGNGLNGIKVTDTASGYITFNTFAGIYAFFGAAPNGQNGFYVDSTGENITARTNVFSGNKKNGIELNGNANGVVIESVILGLDTSGSNPLGNGLNGLYIGGNVKNTTVGVNVPSVIPRSGFSGNEGNGIHISEFASNNQVNLAFIGLSVTGQNSGCKNKKNGVLIDGNANNNLIGYEQVDPLIFTNYSAANNGYGVSLSGDCFLNKVISNYIGYDFDNNVVPNLAGTILNNSSKADTNIIKNNITN